MSERDWLAIREPLEDRTGTRTVPEQLLLAMPTVSCVVAFALGAAALLGWAFSDLILVSALRPPFAMMPLTAATLMLAAASFWIRRSETHGPLKVVGLVLAMVPVVVGVTALVEFVTGIDTILDRLLVPRTLPELTLFTSLLPTPATSIAMVALGTGISLLDAKKPALRALMQLSAAAGGFIGVQAFIGHLIGAAVLYAPEELLFGASFFMPMAAHTAAVVMLLCLGVLFARPDRGVAALCLGSGPGAFMARRLLFVAFLLPTVLGLFGLWGERAGWYNREYALSLVVMATIALLSVLILANASVLRKVDRERSDVEQALRRSEALLRTMFENAGVGVGLVDAKGQPIAANPALARMLGYTPEELVRTPFTKLAHPDDVETELRLFGELVSGKRDSYQIERRFMRKDGSMMWGLLTATVARDRSGRPVLNIGMVEDITERKLAEGTRRRFMEMADSTPDFIGMTDAAGHAIYLNRAGQKMVGVSAEEVTSKTIPDFHPPWAARIIVTEGIPTAIREGSWTSETALQAGDGSEIPVIQSIMAHRNANGELEYLSTMMRDISQRKHREDDQRFLLEASHKLATSLELDELNRDITELVVPRMAECCMLDLVEDGGEVRGAAAVCANPEMQPVLDAMRDKSLAVGPMCGVSQVIETLEPLLVPELTTEWLRGMTNSPKLLELVETLGMRSLMVVPLLVRNRVLGTITMARVMPERRYTDADLGLARELAALAGLAIDNALLFAQSQQATRVRDEVLRIVAHDLRNPLNTILLVNGLLRELLPSELTKARTKLDVIEESVTRSNRLIQDLLDVARMEAGKLELQREPLHAHKLVHHAVEMHRALAQEKRIELIADVPSNLHQVFADHDRVHQIFGNLIGNALKFTPEGGRVKVTVVERTELREVQFSVADTGPGIPKEAHARLFEAFWQAGKKKGGAGLGLSIARHIAEAHGGRIWAETEEGRGSTFHFTLPFTAKDQAKVA